MNSDQTAISSIHVCSIPYLIIVIKRSRLRGISEIYNVSKLVEL
jgi:hypothetical protein